MISSKKSLNSQKSGTLGVLDQFRGKINSNILVGSGKKRVGCVCMCVCGGGGYNI